VVSSRRPTPADVPVGPHQIIRLLRALGSDGKQPIHFRTCLRPHRHGRRSMPRQRPGADHDDRGAAVAPLGALISPRILNRDALDTDRTEAGMSEDRPLLGEFHESGSRAAVECQELSNVRNVWAKFKIWSLTSTASSDRCAPCAGKRTACDQCGKSRRRGSGRATRRIGHQPDVRRKFTCQARWWPILAVLKASHVMSQERNIHSASIGGGPLEHNVPVVEVS
jgi:hypothetical protein